MAALPFLAAFALIQVAGQQAPAVPVTTTAQEEPAEPGQVQEAPDNPQAMVETVEAVPAPPATDAAPPIVQQAPPVAMVPAPIPIAPSDARIQLLDYNPNRIVTLGVSQGFASVVELANDERVENLVVGNSAAWQVTANRRGDRVIVKPLAGAAPSNMIVLTATRRYVFVLDPFSETSFVMRFNYPQPVVPAVAITPAATFKVRGDKALYPLAMYDDGRRTVIRWPAQRPLPAIFAMSGREEKLVNGRMIGDDYVIEGASVRYKFRYGRDEATAYRQTPKRRR
jgi:type IV secretion system protein VirB9